jgi:iron complex transport system substrate-binding protein
MILLVGLLSNAVWAADDTFLDGTGEKIAYGQNCQRIVSLMPNLTEIVAFLGYADKLVGKSVYCNYPNSVLHAEDIGGQVDASLEKIVSLQPDIVLAYQGNSLELVEQLRQLGIQVCALKEATTVKDIGIQMKTLDRILADSDRMDRDRGGEFAEWWLLEAMGRDAAKPQQKESVFFGYPGELVYTAGRGAFINDVIDRCGLRNVVELDDRWPAVSAEYILALDPDWVLTTTSCTEDEDPADAREEMLAELRADPVWRELRAIREGHLIVVNSDHLLRPGPRILLGMKEILAQLGLPVPAKLSMHGATAEH